MNMLSYYKRDDKSAPPETPHLTINPAGPETNILCKYSHYAEKVALFDGEGPWEMSTEHLESVVKQHITMTAGEEVVFTWKGGEPLLAGLDFFRRAVALQAEWGAGRRVRNRLRTNGTLVDEEWAQFLADENFEVVVSIDGPPAIHDRFRLSKEGKGGSWEDVQRGIECLQAAGANVQSSTAIHRVNEEQGLEVYGFLRSLGITAMEFEPAVEREANLRARDLGLRFATPPPLRRNLKCQPRVSSWSVTPRGYAHFMIEVFERWVRNDVGSVTITFFDDALKRWLGASEGLCAFNETCNNCLTVEHDGSLFACDQFVYPSHRRGELGKESLQEVAESPRQLEFAHSKKRDLPEQCRRCRYRFACHGGCPRLRFARSSEGEPGLHYLCHGYQQLFRHLDPYLQLMRRLVEKGREPAEIMAMLNQLPRAVGG